MAEACAAVRHEMDALSLPTWLLVGGDDRAVRCWDLATPRCSHVVSGPGAISGPKQGRSRFAAVLPPSDAATPGDSHTGGDAAGSGVAPADASLHIVCCTPTATGRPWSAQDDSVEAADSAMGTLAAAALAADFECGDDRPDIASQAAAAAEAEAAAAAAAEDAAAVDQLPPLAAPEHHAHGGSVLAAAWLDSPARLLVTAAADGSVRVWR
ncbi:hypothetical protein FNF28_07400 [Cafeteria roenbergensis]|uniref:Uncharacterized protein n=2 Tax=Cafeteria roenbergensis TaxID=33653 RepID=A0A5A8C7Z0_CAFRO|nr:hypothetical protein FNF28_07400 [Cafeteria roenbergensis]